MVSVAALCPCCLRMSGPSCDSIVQDACCVDDSNKKIPGFKRIVIFSMPLEVRKACRCYNPSESKLNWAGDPCIQALQKTGSFRFEIRSICGRTRAWAGGGGGERRPMHQTVGDVKTCGPHGICNPDDTFDVLYRCMWASSLPSFPASSQRL